MKANELMIGDWVSVLAHFLETSTEGTATSGGYNLCRKNCYIGGMNGDLIAIDKICSDVMAYDPIPLTEEMLLANGFKNCGSYEWRDEIYVTIYRYRKPENLDAMVELYFTPCYDGFNIKGIDVNHVHRLQQVLRLCGLNELADNFKLE